MITLSYNNRISNKIEYQAIITSYVFDTFVGPIPKMQNSLIRQKAVSIFSIICIHTRLYAKTI